MNRLLRSVIASAFAVSALAAGVTGAFAASAFQPTVLGVTVPITLTFSGLAASYSGSSPAGATLHIPVGPMTASTNNSLGFHVQIQASTASFAGTGANVATIPVANDTVVVVACPTGDTCTAAAALSASSAQILNRTTSSAGDTFSVDNAILVPAAIPADTYQITENFTVVSN